METAELWSPPYSGVRNFHSHSCNTTHNSNFPIQAPNTSLLLCFN